MKLKCNFIQRFTDLGNGDLLLSRKTEDGYVGCTVES